VISNLHIKHHEPDTIIRHSRNIIETPLVFSVYYSFAGGDYYHVASKC
jgi:hypothetical protein